MLSQCMQVCTLTALLSSLVLPTKAKPVEIYGNANGLWSPTHPHLTSDKAKPNTPVRYVPPEPVIEPEPISDVCPTLQSAPHLCQTT